MVTLISITMVTAPCKCLGKEGKTCNHFLPSITKDSYEMCVICRGQNCSVDYQRPDGRLIMLSGPCVCIHV